MRKEIVVRLPYAVEDAVSGLELMTSLRPPTKPVRAADGTWHSGPVAGSLTAPVDPAPPEAPDEHPVAEGRGDGDALDEEAYEWVRESELLADAEVADRPYVIGLDVNMAFAAAANRLTVGLSEPIFTDGPVFDKKIPGAWYADLSHIELDPRLPSPFTSTGERPTGPAWYATPTLAYAEELGHQVQPLKAYLRAESGPYLDPWYARIRDAYLATMADLGVTKDLTEADYLAAMAGHKQVDPAAAAVLSAIKATVKGGVGKLRERAQGKAKFKTGQRWPALERPTWRPDIRAALISAARVNMHRKMAKMATHGHFPLGVLSDCVVYPSEGPSPLDLLPRTPEGKPGPRSVPARCVPGDGQARRCPRTVLGGRADGTGLQPRPAHQGRHPRHRRIDQGGSRWPPSRCATRLKAALQTVHTRPIPASPQVRMRAVVKAEKGSARAAAARLGCSQRQVERYLKGQVKRPTPRLAAALEREVRRSWQPGLRKAAVKKAAQTGVIVETRAQFGFTAAPGSTDDPRMRRLTEQLPPDVAGQLLAAHAAGASENELQRLLGAGLGHAYFQDRGRRAQGLDVTINHIDYLDVDLT